MTKIAVVHDYFIQMGGAEKVAEEIHSMFPQAPMFSTVDQRTEFPPALENSPVKSSWMRYLPINKKNHRHFFLLYPLAVETLNLSDYDLILSSTSGYAKGVRKKKSAVHVCYCHTPMRWVWRYQAYAEREDFGRFKRAVLPTLMRGLKRWDKRAAEQPDFYIANSQVIADRIENFYGREAVVIPPPIEVERFTPDEPDEDYFLLLSRLAPYKRLDLAIEAFKKTGRPLVVIGDGVARKRLEKMAGPNTRFLGRQPDSVVNQYASRCRALVFPGEEDFGMAPLEINASGRPVIAFRGGGAVETIVENETGIFFDEQTVESLIEGLENFESRVWDRMALRRHAEKFDRRVFQSRILSHLEKVAGLNLSTEFTAPRVQSATAGTVRIV